MSIDTNYLLLATSFIIGVIVGIIFIKTIDSPKRLTFLKSQSEKEASFFETWYLKPGILTIYCNDLEWLSNSSHERVVNALKKKGNNLHLYIQQSDNEIADQLRLFGADVNLVSDGIRSSHVFSVINDEGSKSIIIRNKELEPVKITIYEYKNSPILADLAIDMLD